MVEILDLVNSDCKDLDTAGSFEGTIRTSILDYHSRDTHGSVGRHLNGPQAATLVALLAQLGGPVYGCSMSADLRDRVAHCPRSVALTPGRIVAFVVSATL